MAHQFRLNEDFCMALKFVLLIITRSGPSLLASGFFSTRLLALLAFSKCFHFTFITRRSHDWIILNGEPTRHLFPVTLLMSHMLVASSTSGKQLYYQKSLLTFQSFWALACLLMAGDFRWNVKRSHYWRRIAEKSLSAQRARHGGWEVKQ